MMVLVKIIVVIVKQFKIPFLQISLFIYSMSKIKINEQTWLDKLPLTDYSIWQITLSVITLSGTHCFQNMFSISGVIRNTVVLNYSISHSYILSVVAYDCGMRRSEPLLVTVEVRQACNTGWTGTFGHLYSLN
jgi:uncharacterized membrane protein YqhA